VLELLFREAEAQNCGRQAMLDALFEVVLIQVPRQLVEQGQTQVGSWRGWRIRSRGRRSWRCTRTQREWSLPALVAKAMMSRSTFASGFRKAVGVMPGG
jgi:AraC family transcriptional regulator, alkane utilization regulator